jgi:hypothetical protein
MNTFSSDAEYKAYTKCKVTYEWVCEWWDEFDDIIDTYVIDSPMEVLSGTVNGKGLTAHVTLTRIYGSEAEGIIDRGYAYIADGGLEKKFSSGQKVPKRLAGQVPIKLN